MVNFIITKISPTALWFMICFDQWNACVNFNEQTVGAIMWFSYMSPLWDLNILEMHYSYRLGLEKQKQKQKPIMDFIVIVSC